MLKVTKNTNYKKIIPLTLAILLLLGVGGYFAIANRSDNSSGDTSGQNAEQESADPIDKKQDLIESGSGKPVEDTPDTTTTPPVSSIELSAKQEANNSVTVLTKLFNIGNGTCTLTVSNGAKSTSQQAEVIYQSEFSTCAGFSVPVTDLGTGKWSITLAVSGASTSPKTISLEVR